MCRVAGQLQVSFEVQVYKCCKDIYCRYQCIIYILNEILNGVIRTTKVYLQVYWKNNPIEIVQ